MTSSWQNTDSLALVPPHQIEAEQSLLGGCLVEGFAPDVGLDDWYWDSHQRIHQAITALLVAGQAVDLISVADHLQASGELASCGGAAYLAQLVVAVPSAANAPTYAKIVRDKARVRRVFTLCCDAPARLCNGRPPDEVIAELLGQMHEAARNESARVVDLGTATKSALATIEERMNASPGAARALAATSGVAGLDSITNGFTRDEFSVVAARPSLGKTALLLQSAFAASKSGARVQFFSLEMSTYSLLCRLLSQESGIEGSRLRRGAVTVHEYADVIRAAHAFFSLDFTLDDSSGLTVVDVVDRVRRAKPDVVYLDYLGLLKPHKREANREREVSVQSRVLHGMAKEIKASIVVAVQLNRENEKGKREPCLADLRESGAIEQDADQVVFVHAKDKNDDYRDLIVAKNRNGRTGRCRVMWQGACTRFWEDPNCGVSDEPRQGRARHAD